MQFVEENFNVAFNLYIGPAKITQGKPKKISLHTYFISYFVISNT